MKSDNYGISDKRDALLYSVMQSDRNSLKIDTFRDAMTSELIISS